MSSQNAVSQKLRNGDYKIRMQNSKSEVWSQFGIVTDENGLDLPFAGCQKCKSVLSYAGRSTGTTSMKRHKCRFDSRNQPSITECVLNGPDSPKTVKINETDKERITAAGARMVCRDLTPFAHIGNPGFKDFVQEILNTQAKYRVPLDAEDLLPHPTTVSRKVTSMASEERGILQHALGPGGHHEKLQYSIHIGYVD